MNSETPPEKVIAAMSLRSPSGAVRSRCEPADAAPTADFARSSSSTMYAATLSRSAGLIGDPTSSVTPSAAAQRSRPARLPGASPAPAASHATRRAPTSIAISSVECPSDRSRPWSCRRRCRRSAPRRTTPTAPRRPSRARPSSLRDCRQQLTATKRPASAANSSAIARAFSRSSATPVRISAPVSTAERCDAGRVVRRAMKAPSACLVDGRAVRVRREQDVRLVQDLAHDRDIAVVLALELEAREQQV